VGEGGGGEGEREDERELRAPSPPNRLSTAAMILLTMGEPIGEGDDEEQQGGAADLRCRR
jgi:hypothetical protein